MLLRRTFYNLRKFFFKNSLGESVAILASSYVGTKLIVPHLDYKLHTYRLVKRNGLFLKLDISNEVDHFIYFKKKDSSFDFLYNEIKGSNTILDIGGNIGAFALFFEQLNPAAKIFSFEPHPETFKRLQENLRLNNSHISAFNIGLGDKRSRLKIYEIDCHNIGMNKMFKDEQNFPSVQVEVEALDEFWKDRSNIDFIKIDVEGFEYAVLKGASSLLQKYAPVLVIEIDDNNLRSSGASANKLIELLLDLKYDCIMTSDKKTVIKPEMNFSNCHFDIVATKSNSISTR